MARAITWWILLALADNMTEFVLNAAHEKRDFIDKFVKLHYLFVYILFSKNVSLLSGIIIIIGLYRH